MSRFSVIVLVDHRGWLLLQERDEHAPLSPLKWGLVGGHVDEGEDFEPAAYRELEEETGIRLAPGDLALWRDETFTPSDSGTPGRYTVWVAPTRLTDADIVLGEGRQIVFVDPAEVLDLDLGDAARHFLTELLASSWHAGLTAAAQELRGGPGATAAPTGEPGTRPLTLLPVPGHGAEDVLVDRDGWVLTGTEDGSVFRVRPDGRRIDRVGHTSGRPLGLELLPDGRVLVCDAIHGLLALDTASGRTEVLADRVGGRRIKVCNNAAVHTSGDIYFSDSSQVFPLERWRADIAENTGTGRLLRRSADGSVEVLVEGLRFANGVALAADESFVAVAESGAGSVVRRWLTGPRAGETDHLAGRLPGYPDNIALGSDGLIWVAIATPRSAAIDRVQHAPHLLRRAAWRLPRRLQPQVRRTVRAIALDASGRTVHDVSADASRFHMVTGVREHEGRLWLGSLEHGAIGVVDLTGAPANPDR